MANSNFTGLFPNPLEGLQPPPPKKTPTLHFLSTSLYLAGSMVGYHCPNLIS